MLALKIIGVIAFIVFLFCMIPVGADIAYEAGELAVSAKVCGVLLQLFPKEPSDGETKPKKPKKEKKKKEKKPEEETSEQKPKKKRKLDFSRDEILGLIKAVLKGLGKFRKTKVDRFLLHWVCAGIDPYDTAQGFGYVNAALSMLAPLCRKRFQVKDCSVRTEVDFTTTEMKLDFGLAISIRIGQIFGVINTIVFGALWILIKHKARKLWARITKKDTAAEATATEEVTKQSSADEGEPAEIPEQNISERK